MIKKTIKYTDYNDVAREEDFYFNLNQAELIEMDALHNGNYAAIITDAVEKKDVAEIMKIFKSFIEKSYGVKSADGRTFEKSPEITRSFMQSEAYSELLVELANDADAASAFVEGILPKKKTEIKEVK